VAGCRRCATSAKDLASAHEVIAILEAERDALRVQLREVSNHAELLGADLERYKKAFAAVQPNQPERVPEDQMQLAFERVLAGVTDKPLKESLLAATANEDEDPRGGQSGGDDRGKAKPRRKKRGGGRRPIDPSSLPLETIVIDPDEVVAVGGEGYKLISEECTERLGYQRARFRRVRFIRRKWLAKSAVSEIARILTAPLPESIWPGFMADPSVVAHVIVNKYDYSLPLHRQQRMTKHAGFQLPRSTQCSWIEAAYNYLRRIPEAMRAESTARAFCIATDATGAPVRVRGGSKRWHLFVLLGDDGHVVFRPSRAHTSEAISTMLAGFKGHVLADASTIYDVLYRDHGMFELGCWSHVRRYFWRALPSDGQRAYEALAILRKLFAVERKTRDLALPDRTAERARLATPILATLDDWLTRNRDHADPGGPLAAAIGYHDNQRTALRRFLSDGRLRIDNNLSEQQLRSLVLLLNNSGPFATANGLRWYAVFRSLIASAHLHELEPQLYLEQILRLAPHWPANRVIELAPKYWRSTLANLSERERAIVEPPWTARFPMVQPQGPPIVTAA